MFDPKNRLHFKDKSPRDKMYEILTPSSFVKLTDEEKKYVNKCKVSRHFRSNQVMHREVSLIYEKYFQC